MTLERLRANLADRYQIERELGAGGMATVYLAQDLRHDRKVALKVLRPELAAVIGAERFLAEIKTTAHLQHPHILPLHDSGEADGTVFYVMPFVEGESLRDRIQQEHELPVEDAVRIATEVLDALEYAHGQGVIHRDIKPENILLHGGHALVADFGIALAASRSEGATRLTETGMSLGTPAYMAPEQAMGERALTPRADIYALGCVLYEMLSGEPPFMGPTAQAIIARVMTEEPRALTLHRHTIPPHVEAAVRKALEKLPADRFATAKEFAAALRDPGFTTAFTAARTQAAVAPSRQRRALAIAPWAVAGAALVVAAVALFRPRPAAPVIRYGLALPPSETPVPSLPIIPSPDGSQLLFVGRQTGAAAQTGANPLSAGPSLLTTLASNSQLWLKARDAYSATPIPGTQLAWNATFSPDGQWVAFVQSSQLKKVGVSGGSPSALGDSAAPNWPGIAWLDDGTIVYIGLGARSLRRVPALGGPSSVVLQTDAQGIQLPRPLPHARGVLYEQCSDVSCASGDLWVLDLRSGEPHRLIPGAMMAQYLPTGHLLYVRPDGAAFAVPFEVGSLKLTGQPVALLDSIATDPGYPLLAVSRSGTLVMRTGSGLGAGNRYQMVWVDRSGNATPIDMGGPLQIDPYGGNPGWALAPDGRRLAIGLLTAAGGDIWVKDLPSGPLSRVTFDSAPDLRPRWMPGGRALTFVAVRDGAYELHRVNADGTGDEQVVARDSGLIFEGAASPDGRWIVARIRGGLGHQGRDIVGFHQGDSVPVPIVASPAFDENAFALSPDGRWIVYESDETGRREVYVRPFPHADSGKMQVSTDGGYAPLWARSGRELFYVDAQRRMMVAAFTPGPEPRVGTPRVLFQLPADFYLWENDYYTPYDISPDGQRFIMVQRIQATSDVTVPLIVVENWFTELKRKLAGR
jgi:eukaryotic-like serine/threonine-protein kinase